MNQVTQKVTTLVNLVNGIVDTTYRIIEVISRNKVVKKVIYLVGASIFGWSLRYGAITSETPIIQPQKTPTVVVQHNKAQPGQEMKNSRKTSSSVTKIVDIVGGDSNSDKDNADSDTCEATIDSTSDSESSTTQTGKTHAFVDPPGFPSRPRTRENTKWFQESQSKPLPSGSEADSSDNSQANDKKTKSEIKTEFDYRLDRNGDPILLIPDTGPLASGIIDVVYRQTKTHLHHAPELGIKLPSDFDIAKYKARSTAGRLQYATEKVPRETIIVYQNKIAEAISEPVISVPGFAGKQKTDVKIKIKLMPQAKGALLSVIDKRNNHVTTYFVTKRQLDNLKNDNFWVLQGQKFY